MAFNIDFLKPSTTMRNSKGAIGHPFLSPLSDLKKGEATPLTSKEKETEDRLLITHEIKDLAKPILDRMTHR